jgi:Pyruvate/2-oxoacid:ferredoxin oxidoreductase gamma subunit
LGTPTQPVVNTAILGAFVRATDIVSLDSLLEAIDREVPANGEENRIAATEAYEQVSLEVSV